MLEKNQPIYLVAQRKPGVQLDGRIPPFGIMCVGQALRRAGFRVRLFHLLGQGGEAVLRDAVEEERPLFVGFSNCVSTTIAHDLSLSRWLHARGIKVVWGGVFATSLAELTLRSGFVDYVVKGEGERPAPLLAEAIAGGSLPAGIPGVGYCHGEDIKIEPPLPLELELDQYPLALDLVDWKDYIIRGPGNVIATSLNLSRGCPLGCSFCTNSMDPDRKIWRGYSPEYVKEMVSFLKRRYNVNALYLQDDNPFGKLREGMRQIESLGLKWISAAHLLYASADFLDWAKDRGCLNLSFGIESGSDSVLKRMNKKINRDTIRERLRLCGEKKIPSWAMWMAFVPGETSADRGQTFALMDEIYQSNPIVQMHLSVYQAFPGTPFYEQSKKIGLQEPQTLDEWAAYTGRINRFMGVGDRRVNRMNLDLRALYYRERSRNRLHPLLRKLLRRRVKNASFAAPLEEALHYARVARDALRGLFSTPRTGLF